MELLICLVALGVFALLAIRFGADSRETPYSKEKELADLGLVHDSPTSRVAALGTRTEEVAAMAASEHPAEQALSTAV